MGQPSGKEPEGKGLLECAKPIAIPKSTISIDQDAPTQSAKAISATAKMAGRFCDSDLPRRIARAIRRPAISGARMKNRSMYIAE